MHYTHLCPLGTSKQTNRSAEGIARGGLYYYMKRRTSSPKYQLHTGSPRQSWGNGIQEAVGKSTFSAIFRRLLKAPIRTRLFHFRERLSRLRLGTVYTVVRRNFRCVTYSSLFRRTRTLYAGVTYHTQGHFYPPPRLRERVGDTMPQRRTKGGECWSIPLNFLSDRKLPCGIRLVQATCKVLMVFYCCTTAQWAADQARVSLLLYYM